MVLTNPLSGRERRSRGETVGWVTPADGLHPRGWHQPMTDGKQTDSSDVEAEVQNGGVLIRFDGGSRFLFPAEVAELCDNDDPVTVR
jgi:hypothetical protein